MRSQKEARENTPLHVIAQLIMRRWPEGMQDEGTREHIQAMGQMDSIDETFELDAGPRSGREIVAGFLERSGTWQTDLAREVKVELHRRVMEKES
jgi:hypothetical protein